MEFVVRCPPSCTEVIALYYIAGYHQGTSHAFDRVQAMTQKLSELVEKLRHRSVTPQERQAQRISFAYGNVAIENPLVTREMVIQAAAELDAEAGAAA